MPHVELFHPAHPTPKVSTHHDRPGWIPPDVGDTWDDNPYAYQTEEELMPAGGLHGVFLAYIIEVLRHPLATRGLMLLLDIFLLYRDAAGVKQRCSPDLLLMPLRMPPPSAYDLDVESPPLWVAEVTSPRSHRKDKEAMVEFYFGLGVQRYLVIDAISPQGNPRPQIELYGWELVDGKPSRMIPDVQGGVAFPEMGIIIQAAGKQLRFFDLVTGAPLLDAGDLSALAYDSQQRAEAAAQQVEAAEQRAEVEAQARLEAEAEVARLRTELARLKGEQSPPQADAPTPSD